MPVGSELRDRRLALLVKEETVPGVEETPSPSANAIIVDDAAPNPQPSIIESNEKGGGLDKGLPTVGAMPYQLTVQVPFKGADAVGANPEYDILLRICGWARTAQAAIAAKAAAAGTTTTVDVDIASSTFPAVAGALAGMPLTLAGDVPSQLVGCTKWELVTGTVWRATINKTFAAALTTSTTVAVPQNLIYRPQSGTIPTATIYLYVDGLLWKLLGARGDFAVTLTSGNKGELTFTLSALFGGKSDAAVPTVSGTVQARPPIWRAGTAAVFHHLAAIQQMTCGFNNTVTLPDDPNQPEALRPPVIGLRDVKGTINPLEENVATRNLLLKVRGNEVVPITALYGVTPGNRLGITIEEALLTNETREVRNELLAAQYPFSSAKRDRSAALCLY